MKNTLIGRMKDIFAELTGKNKFDKDVFVLLKTVLMLAAVDGEVGEDEVACFKDFSSRFRGYNGESFEALWEAAMRSAGYLMLLSRFSSRDELVEAFVKESEKDFVKLSAQETTKERERAFVLLDQMAKADGDYSEIERACIAALSQKVETAWKQAVAERYPRAAKFD